MLGILKEWGLPAGVKEVTFFTLKCYSEKTSEVTEKHGEKDVMID